MYVCLQVKNLLSCQIVMKLEFSGQIFRKNSQILNFMKISLVGAVLFHGEERTDISDEAMLYKEPPMS